MSKQFSLERIVEKLLILETRKLEAPEHMSTEDWREYSHLKTQYKLSQKSVRQRKLSFSYIRKYSDGIVYRSDER